jgi:hypothetical protein
MTRLQGQFSGLHQIVTMPTIARSNSTFGGGIRVVSRTSKRNSSPSALRDIEAMKNAFDLQHTDRSRAAL